LGGAVVVTIYKKASDKATKPLTSYNPAIEARSITQEDYDKAKSTKRAEFLEAKL
jgi:sterol carrier protein 2